MNLILILSTLLLLFLITFFCEIFTNAVENLGKYFKIKDGALGSIFAAFGTALPETVLPLIAVFGAYVTGGEVSLGKDIGRGAVLGSPFLLSTLAFFIVGITISVMCFLKKRTDTVCIDINHYKRDLKFFASAYTIGVVSAFIPFVYAKVAIGCFLLAFYLFYAVRTVKKFSCDAEYCENETEPLKFAQLFKISEKYFMFLLLLQFLISVAGLVLSAHFFVENLKEISAIFGISAMIVSLFLAPVATELPETVNAILWSIHKKDVLAVGNISGAMVFQACIPMAVGIFFTDWTFSHEAAVNVCSVYLALFILVLGTLKQKCFSAKIFLFSGIPYLLFVIYTLFCAKI